MAATLAVEPQPEDPPHLPVEDRHHGRIDGDDTTIQPGPRGRLPAAAGWAVVGVAVLTGVVLRGLVLGTGSLWLDELWTLDAVSRSYEEMVGARLVSDQSPPLWTSLAWLWVRVVGTYDESAVRVLPLLVGVVAVLAPVLGAWRMPRLRPTLLATAALLALSTLPLQFSVEYRSYSLAIAAASVALVVWAGLVTGELRPTGRRIFLLALAGALGGFAHYYGNLVHAALLLTLAVAFLRRRQRQPLVLLMAWGALSFLPVVAWWFATRKWSPGIAVAADPGLPVLQDWLQWAYAPLAPLLARQEPGYADGSPRTGLALLGLVAVVLLVTGARVLVGGRDPDRSGRLVTLLGLASLTVVGTVVGLGYLVSVLLPPSLNARNLAPVVPALLLATACAATSSARPARRWVGATATAAVCLLASVTWVALHGVDSDAPVWQTTAGYRGAAQAVVASHTRHPGAALVGLEQAWSWHGDWDVVLRDAAAAGLGGPDDALPLPVQWVASADDPALAALDGRPVIVFGYVAGDGRAEALVAWAEETAGPCTTTSTGGPGPGGALVARCAGSA